MHRNFRVTYVAVIGRGVHPRAYEKKPSKIIETAPSGTFQKLVDGRDAYGDGACLVVGHARDHDDFVALCDVAVCECAARAGLDHLFDARPFASEDGVDAPAQVDVARDHVVRRVGDNRCLRAVLRHDARGVAGLGRREDRRRARLVRELYGRVRDGVCDGGAFANAARADDGVVLERFLHAQGDGTHHLDRLDGVIAARGLAREHDGVRAVKDGVADVRDLRACGARVRGHGFEHLRGDDDGLADGIALADDFLLDDRDILCRHLDAEIAARDHDAVRDGEDRVEIIDAREVFDLWDDLHVSAVLGDEVSDLLNVRGALDEGGGNEVHVVLDAKNNVALVLLGDRREAQLDAGRSDAFARGHGTAVLDRRHDVLAAHLVDDESDETVREEERVAGFDLFPEFLMVDADVRLVAGRVVVGQCEFVPLFEMHLPFGELAEAHLGAFGIEDERDDLARALRRRAHLLDAHEVFLMCAVGEVKARAVHPILDERVHNPVRIGRRPLRAYDLGFLQHHKYPRLLFPECL